MSIATDEREQRNAVFQAAYAPPGGMSTPGMPAVSTVEQLKADFGGLELPSEVVPLPSLGLAYDRAHPWANTDRVEIKGMTAREEDILTSRAFLKKGTVITELIRSCLVDNRVDPSSLLAGDRNALVVAIRITGYGAEYEAEVDCVSCEERTPAVFDLGQLPLRPLAIRPIEENKNLFAFTLPRSGKKVCFRFLTGKDEQDITATAEQQRKLALGGDQVVTTNLLHSIVSIEGVTDRAKIASFVRNGMRAGDSLALRSFIKENEPGIQMRQAVECRKCGASEEVDMPMGVKFLWPHAG